MNSWPFINSFNYLLQTIISSCQNQILTHIYALVRVFWYRGTSKKTTILVFSQPKGSLISKPSIKLTTTSCTSRTTEMPSSKSYLQVISKSTINSTKPKSKTKANNKHLTSPSLKLEPSHKRRNLIWPLIAIKTQSSHSEPALSSNISIPSLTSPELSGHRRDRTVPLQSRSQITSHKA